MVTVLTIISPNQEETLKQCPEIMEHPNGVVINYTKDEDSDSYEGARTCIFDAIKSGKDVYIYGDTWSREERLDLLSYIRIYTKEISSITLVAPYEEKMLTSKEFPHHLRKLQLPLLSEKFSSTEIRHVNPKQETVLLADLIQRASIFDMGQPGKDELLSDHLFRTAWHASDDFGPGESAESIAGMYHDYGKLYAQRTDYLNEAHYLCTAEISTYLFLSLMPTLQEQYGKDPKTLEKAAKLINYLPAAKRWHSDATKDVAKHRFAKDGLYESLVILHEANMQCPQKTFTK